MTEPYPEWVTDFRPHQVTATEQILDGFARGKRVMVLDAPVGAGKTLIAEMVRRGVRDARVRGEEWAEDARGDMLYVAHSRGLQDQFLADFPYARVLKGRANYPTQNGVEGVVNAGDCTRRGATPCKWCDERASCPYEVAKNLARGARIAVVNTSYMIREAGGKGALCTGRGFTCVDECDTLEDILLGVLEFGLRERDVAGLEPLKKGVHGKTIASWLREEWMARAKGELARLPAGSEDVKVLRRRRALIEKMAGAARAADGIETGGWVRDYAYGYELMLKPVRVDWAAEDRVWRHSQRWLMMSGTVVDAEVMCGELGLGRDEWELVEVPMTFERENRLVHAVPVADLSRKAMQEDGGKGGDREMAALKDAIWVVLDRHAGENTLIHTVSYQLTREIVDVVRDWRETRAVTHPDEDGVRVWWYDRAQDRDVVLEDFKRHGGVLIGPSLDRGVDLPGDLCRVQIVCKVPFPYLGDRRVAERARGEGGSRWYATQTARTLVQMTGRGVRGADDWCVSYVLDKQFMRWWKNDGKRLLPRWWRDAMVVGLVKDYQ